SQRFSGSAQTDEQGRYEIPVQSDMIYMVHVEPGEFVAAARSGFAVLGTEPVEGIDFTLQPAIRLHGRLTAGPNRNPVVNHHLNLQLQGASLDELEGVELPDPNRRDDSPGSTGSSDPSPYRSSARSVRPVR